MARWIRIVGAGLVTESVPFSTQTLKEATEMAQAQQEARGVPVHVVVTVEWPSLKNAIDGEDECQNPAAHEINFVGADGVAYVIDEAAPAWAEIGILAHNLQGCWWMSQE